MDTYEKIIKKSKHELDELASKENFGKADFEDTYMLLDIIKDAQCIMDEEMGGGNSYRGNSYGMGEWTAEGEYSSRGGNNRSYNDGMNSRRSYNDGMNMRNSYDDGMSMRDSYEGGSSYARGGNRQGMHYVRGHYSRAGADLADEMRETMREGEYTASERATLEKAIEIMKK